MWAFPDKMWPIASVACLDAVLAHIASMAMAAIINSAHVCPTDSGEYRGVPIPHELIFGMVQFWALVSVSVISGG